MLHRFSTTHPLATLLLAIALAIVPTAHAKAQSSQMPDGVNVDYSRAQIDASKLNAQVPLDMTFTNEHGRKVTLGDIFTGERPVVVSLVYFTCPMLCSIVLDGMVDALKEIDDLKPGRDYDIVTVSIDPRDTAADARKAEDRWVDTWGDESIRDGWHFLTSPGNELPLKQFASTIGWNYYWNEVQQEYMHSAGIFVLTPGGRVSQIHYGVLYDIKTVRLSMIDSSDGKIGTIGDYIFLYCFSFDHSEGRYTSSAIAIMRIAGAMTVLVLLFLLLGLFMFDARRRKLARLKAAEQVEIKPDGKVEVVIRDDVASADPAPTATNPNA